MGTNDHLSWARIPAIQDENSFYEIIDFLKCVVNENKINSTLRKRLIYIINNCDNREKITYSKVTDLLIRNFEKIYDKRIYVPSNDKFIQTKTLL